MRGVTGVGPARWPIASLTIMAGAVFLSVTTELVVAGLLPGMSEDLRVTPGRVGLLVTGYAAMVILFAAPLGFATARFPRRALLASAIGVYAVSNAVMAVSTSFALALAARVVGGLTHAVFWITISGYVSRIISPDRVGRALTVVFGGGNLAVLIGIPAGTALGVAIGWRATFGVLAVVALVLAAAVLRVLPEPGATPAASRVRLARAVRVPGLLALVSITAVTVFGHFSFTTYVGPFLLHTGVTEAAIAAVLLGYGVGGTAGVVLAGVFVDRRLRTATVVGAAVAVGTYALLVVAVATPATVTTTFAVVGTCLAGAAMGALPIFWQTMITRIGRQPSYVDAGTALNASAFNIGIGGGALLGGLVVDRWGPVWLPALATVLTGAGLVLTAVRWPLTAAQGLGDGGADDGGDGDVAAGGDPDRGVRVGIDDDRA
jgi:predicted MFS family arabinose efflux permease